MYFCPLQRKPFTHKSVASISFPPLSGYHEYTFCLCGFSSSGHCRYEELCEMWSLGLYGEWRLGRKLLLRVCQCELAHSTQGELCFSF